MQNASADIQSLRRAATNQYGFIVIFRELKIIKITVWIEQFYAIIIRQNLS